MRHDNAITDQEARELEALEDQRADDVDALLSDLEPGTDPAEAEEALHRAGLDEPIRRQFEDDEQ